MRMKFEIRHTKGNVKVEGDRYTTHLLSTSNGYQWSGMQINRKAAKQIIETLIEYLESDKDKNND